MKLHFLWIGWLLTVLLTGCPFTPDPEEEPEPLPEMVTLAAGQMAEFTYPADGQWHPSGIMVERGQELTIRPAQDCVGWDRLAMRFRLGRVPAVVRGEESFVVTRSGRLEFWTDVRRIDPGAKTACVQVIRHQ